MDCDLQKNKFILIISEKPKAAKSIAYAISSHVYQCNYKNVPYWVASSNNNKIVVAPVAGHLFSLATNTADIPVFDYTWIPRWKAEKKAKHTKKFFELIKYLSSNNPLTVINACDYDIEGSVIGYLVITLITKRMDYKRMKFSSLTPGELRSAFNNLHPRDFNMVEAGLCRHELDWIYGINLSRLLMNSYKKITGERKTLSVGRVQTPTLIEIINRYIEVETYCNPPVFSLYALITYRKMTFTAYYAYNPLKKLMDAKKIKEMIERNKIAIIEDVKKTIEDELPRPPFNLNDLQEEAYRLFGFSPSYTQKIAEELYLDGLISYPRTNSQKLPVGLDTRTILENLSAQGYEHIVKTIFEENPKLIAREGKKTDPAHPAIYPTGIKPRSLRTDHKKLYELIVKRFLASFMSPARYIKLYIKWNAGVYLESSIKSLLKKGWLQVYDYNLIEDERYVEPVIGESGYVDRIDIRQSHPDKPSYHTKSSILRWMETNNIGTEATRAEIIEILFKRKYVIEKERKAKPTTLGLAIAEIAKRFFPELTSVELSRSFEEKIEKVRQGTLSRQTVVEEAKSIVKKLIDNGLRKEIEIQGTLRNLVISPSKKCLICDLYTDGDLCYIHSIALEKLIENLESWKNSYGIDSEKAIHKIYKSRQVGKAIREVAQKIIEGQIII